MCNQHWETCDDPRCAVRKGCRWCGPVPVYFDINSLDPLERQGDDSRDLQFDVEREREQGGDVRYYGIGE